MKLRLILLCVVLAMTGTRALAVLSGTEKRAFDSAAATFGLGIWDRAEVEFAQFIEKYPKSERLNEAILLQAQSQFRQRKFDSAAELLRAREADAGQLTDQFLFWLAEAQFQNGNYVEAVGSFGKLAREFPASNRRLEASVGEAASRLRLSEWAQVTNLL